MTRLRARGNLTCFYCGKRSAVKFDGTIRDFVCLHCDATNYLDKVRKGSHAQEARTLGLTMLNANRTAT